MGSNISRTQTKFDRTAVLVLLVKCRRGGYRIVILIEKRWSRIKHKYIYVASFAGGGYEQKDGTNRRGMRNVFFACLRVSVTVILKSPQP